MACEVIAKLCDHAQGNPRTLMIMAGELPAAVQPRYRRRPHRQIRSRLLHRRSLMCATNALSRFLTGHSTRSASATQCHRATSNSHFP